MAILPNNTNTNSRGIKTRGTTSTHKAVISEKNRMAEIYDSVYEATAVFRGRFDLYVGEVICIKVYCKDGSLHFTSGNYLILERTDEISGDFITILKLKKENTFSDI